MAEAGVAREQAERAQGAAQEKAKAALVAADARVKDAQTERERVQQQLSVAERDLAVQRERTGAVEKERADIQIRSTAELSKLQEQLRNAEENRRRVQRATELEQGRVATALGGDKVTLAKLEAERDAAAAQVAGLQQQLGLRDIELKGVRQGAEIQRTLSAGQLSQLQEQLRNARDESRALERQAFEEKSKVATERGGDATKAAALGAQAAAADAKVQDLQRQLGMQDIELQGARRSLADTTQTLGTKITTLTQQQGEVSGKHLEQLSRLQQQLQQQEAAHAAATSKLEQAALTGRAIEAQEKAKLRAEAQQASSHIANLQQQMSVLSSDVGAEKGRVRGLTADVASQQHQLGQLFATKGSLERRVQELKQDVQAGDTSMQQDLAKYEAEKRNVDRKIADAYTQGERAGVSVGQLKAQAPLQDQIRRIQGDVQLHQRELQMRAMQAELKQGDPMLDAELKNLRKQILAMEQQKGTAQAVSTAALASTQEQQRETVKQIHDRHRSELFQSEKQLREMKAQLAKGDPTLDKELESLRQQIQEMDKQRAVSQTQAKSQVQAQAAQVTSAEAITAQVEVSWLGHSNANNPLPPPKRV